MADFNGTRISTEELKTLLSSLKEQKELINGEYKNSIRSVLESSSSCFSVSGVDYSRIISIFDDTFNSLDSNFEILINVLENNVIKNYSELAVAIKKMFDDNFANKLSELLGVNERIGPPSSANKITKYVDGDVGSFNKVIQPVDSGAKAILSNGDIVMGSGAKAVFNQKK